jgi:hypothetical protein
MTKPFVAALLLGLACCAAPLRAESWVAQPIVVHEWGVQQFNWGAPRSGRGDSSVVPGYMYTDAHPGKQTPMPQKRVKDLPPDSGIRLKPILYFYPTYGMGEARVGIELRFAQGHANAWFPQANVYRTPEVAARGREPDWVAWKKTTGSRYDPKNPVPVPDDTRMELAWYSLALSADLPQGQTLPGESLPADHWARLARNVPAAAYISNGAETEKYLFYEGATREQPDVAIVPGSFGDTSPASAHIVNISSQPIFNLFAIYRAGGRVWVGYLSSLEPMAAAKEGAENSTPPDRTVAGLALPDFAGQMTWTDEHAFAAATSGRLLAALTEGSSFATKVMRRDPADAQGPAASAQLFPEEAAALEKIWRRDFFEAGEGLTLLYRQSPAALDAAMPLNIHADMYHFVSLSRCGLVLNSNIDLKTAEEVYWAVRRAALPVAGNPATLKTRDDALALLRGNPILARTALAYHERLSGTKAFEEVRRMLEEK